MYTKQDIWASFKKELDIIKHLAGKIPAGKEHHKPTEKQRTTLELLQYLSVNGAGNFAAILSGDTGGFAKYVDRSKEVTVENFAAAIDWEESEMKTLFGQFNDENLSESVTLFGRTQSRALFLLDFLKMLTGYKMQLFLYAKGSGNETIGTPNVWAGMDAPVPVK